MQMFRCVNSAVSSTTCSSATTSNSSNRTYSDSVVSAQAVLTPYAANQAFVRGQFRLAAIADVIGCVAAEGVIPYPPGIMCIAPGECWNTALIGYLTAVQALVSAYPEFAPHIQGVYYGLHADGTVALQVHVLEGV